LSGRLLFPHDLLALPLDYLSLLRRPLLGNSLLLLLLEVGDRLIGGRRERLYGRSSEHEADHEPDQTGEHDAPRNLEHELHATSLRSFLLVGESLDCCWLHFQVMHVTL